MRVRLFVLRLIICWVIFIGPRRLPTRTPELRPAY
jgi:hypothetical protein